MAIFETYDGYAAVDARRTAESSPLAAVARAFRAGQRWYRYRRTLRQLQTLDDRMLKDIGLSRDDVMRVARRTSGYPV